MRYSNANSEEDNEFALNRLKKAIEKAGIGPVVFEYEPVAAAYFYESTLDHDELIMIGDFGGGTSDFSLLRVGPSARRDRARNGGILGNEGVALAGDAFDARIVRNLVSPALGRGSQFHSVDKILPMPTWVYSDLERWHYLSFLKSSDTLQMLRSIEAHSLEPKKIAALLARRARGSWFLSAPGRTGNEVRAFARRIQPLPVRGLQRSSGSFRKAKCV